MRKGIGNTTDPGLPRMKNLKKPLSKKKKKKKSKGKHKKRSRSSSSSSSSSDDEEKHLTKLVKHREDHKLTLKEKKELMKRNETVEEKRKRRLEKKKLKEQRLKEKAGWTEETLHYTNDDNPYGDSNLHSTFIR